MDELKFVIKCFLFTCVLFAASQYKAEGVTLEAKIHSFLVSMPVAEFVNNSAHGAVILIRKSEGVVTELLNDFANKSESKFKATNLSSSRKNNQIDIEDINLIDEK